MSLTLRSVLFWGSWFLVPELLAVFWTGCPWDTLSGTFWRLIAYWHPVWYFVVIFGVVLLGHFGYHWRARYLIVIAVLSTVAVLIHLFFRDAPPWL